MRLLLLVAAFAHVCRAKIVSGVAHLNSMNTETFITKFSFSPTTVGGSHLSKIRAKFHTKSGSYFHTAKKHDLVLLLIPDDKWATYGDMVKKGSLCSQRTRGLRVWWKSVQPEAGPLPKDGSEVFQVTSNVAHHYHKARYFHVLLADCRLEDYDAGKVPPIEYEIWLLNGNSHLPVDELGLGAFHLTLAVMLAVLIIAASFSAYRQLERHGEVHLTAVALCVALGLQFVSEILEFLHFTVYSFNGKGLRWRHTWFPGDFIAELAGFSSEAIVTILLLAIASGWTLLLPGKNLETMDLEALEGGESSKDENQSDKKKEKDEKDFRSHRGGDLLSFLGLQGEVLDKLHPPIRNSLRVAARSYSRLEMSLASPSLDDIVLQMFFAAILIVQLLLEFMGRSYEDDFNSFHDHDHWPGLTLMAMRIFFACMCWVGSSRTLADDRLNPGAKRLLTVFKYASAAWFLAFPLIVAVAELFVTIFAQHFVVVTFCSAIQTGAMIVLLFAFLDPVGAMTPMFKGKLKDLGVGDVGVKEGATTLGFSDASSVGRFHHSSDGSSTLRSRKGKTKIATD